MKKKIVVFGGGTGLSSLLKGLKDFDKNLDQTQKKLENLDKNKNIKGE